MRIAAVQSAAIIGDVSRASDVIVRRMAWADESGIDIVEFPETFLSGHSYDPATILARGDMAASAIAALRARIAAFRPTLVVGAFEAIGGQVFNTALVIEAGRIVGRYAKAHPNEPGVTAGNHFPTFLRSGIRYGVNICNDANYPDVAQRIADQGARLILYPLNNMLPRETADRWRTKSLANLIDRARQTGCWIASSDVTGTSGDLVSHGCTAVVTPKGRVIVHVPEMREGAAVYEVPGPKG